MTITAAMVKELREKTGLPMMDCKKALQEAEGDTEAAIEILRKKGIGKIEKMSGRETSQGRVACHTNADNGRIGIVELRCETAPVAATDDFIALAQKIAAQAASLETPTTESVLELALPDDATKKTSDAIHDVFNRLRENIQVARVASFAGHVGHYIHHNGQVGVLVEFSGECPEETKIDICMHVTAMNPPYTQRADVPADQVERKRAESTEGAQGKPAEIVEKIVTGKLKRWYGDIVLVDQPFVKEEKKSVGQVLNAVTPGLTVSRFARFAVGDR